MVNQLGFANKYCKKSGLNNSNTIALLLIVKFHQLFA